MQASTAGALVAVSSLREFFRDAFHTASEHQRLGIDEQAEQYVVNLLTMFSRADALYERTPDGLRIRPLAHMLADALEAPSASARQRGLQPWVRRVSPRKVELRRVKKHVFFDEEDNGAGPRKLLLQFEREDDAENFVGALIDLSS